MTAILCVSRVTDGPPAVESVKSRCSECRQPVWVSRLGSQMPSKLVCTCCLAVTPCEPKYLKTGRVRDVVLGVLNATVRRDGFTSGVRMLLTPDVAADGYLRYCAKVCLESEDWAGFQVVLGLVALDPDDRKWVVDNIS